MSKQLNPNILGQNLEVKANENPDKVILTFENAKHPEETQTYRQLHENSHRLARALLEAGLDKGDRFSAMMRKMFGGESLFVGQYSAPGGGWLVASPYQPGTVLYRKVTPQDHLGGRKARLPRNRRRLQVPAHGRNMGSALQAH